VEQICLKIGILSFDVCILDPRIVPRGTDYGRSALKFGTSRLGFGISKI
jgi:hypothetical protein